MGSNSVSLNNTNTSTKLVSCTQGEGVGLVLLHGWGTNSQVFSALLPLLVSQFRVTTIDLPGFGTNHGTELARYSLTAICEKLDEIIPPGSIVAGWSLGGLIAQQYAISYAHKVAGLVGICTSPFFVKEQGWPGIESRVLNAFVTDLCNNYARTVDRFLTIQAMGSVSARQDVKNLKKCIKRLPSPSVLALEQSLNLLTTGDVREQLGRISCPTLRLYGRLDSLVPVSAVDAIHALHPQSDNVILSKASHAPFISHPQACAQLITRFISDCSFQLMQKDFVN